MTRLLYVIACTIVAAGWATEALRRWLINLHEAHLGEIE